MRFTLRRDSTSRRNTLLSKENFKFRIEMIVDDTKLKRAVLFQRLIICPKSLYPAPWTKKGPG